MSKKQKIIPKLRFPEFKNGGEWGEKLIEEVTISESSSIALNKLELKSSGYPVYGADSIVGYIDEFQQSEKYISIVKDGSGVGRLNLCQSHSSILGTLACLKSKNKKQYHLDWIYYLLNTIDFSGYVKGAGIPHIYYSDFKKENVAVPKPHEQQKIASCLSSLDEVIADHSQKSELFKNHKKGLMQNLFPQEGKQAPKYRFKEFNGKWEKSKLTEHIDLLSGFAFQSIFFSEEGKKLLTPKNFTKNGAADFNNGNTKYTTEVCDGKYICGENDLLLLLTDLTPSCELLGKPVMLKKHDGEVLLNQRIVKVLFKTNFNRDFLLQFFLTDIFHQRIKDTASGSTVRHSSNKIVLDTELYYPINPKEQEKIASCLSSLDEIISVHEKKIEQLKLHKRGLMQGLFPKIID